jgi:hypothetical protein
MALVLSKATSSPRVWMRWMTKLVRTDARWTASSHSHALAATINYRQERAARNPIVPQFLKQGTKH